MVPVEADAVRVESRPAGSNARRAGMVCSAVRGMRMPGGSTGWVFGFGRGGGVRVCALTHVLLPVTVLRRRTYAVERIWAALSLRADGPGGGGKAPGDEFWIVAAGGSWPAAARRLVRSRDLGDRAENRADCFVISGWLVEGRVQQRVAVIDYGQQPHLIGVTVYVTVVGA